MVHLDIERYFAAEKAESLLFLLVGAAALAAATWGGLVLKTRLAYGAAGPLVLVGLIQLVVGGTVYFRSDAQAQQLVTQWRQEPARFAAAEIPRMRVVNRNFIVYRWVEIGLALVGAGVAWRYRTQPTDFWYGLGWALLVQSLFMLGADYFAERRASRYTSQVQALLPPAAPL